MSACPRPSWTRLRIDLASRPKPLMNTKIEDQAALFDFIAEHWEEVGDEAKLNIKIDAVKQHMEQNDGRPPPGMSVSYFTRLNIKRS